MPSWLDTFENVFFNWPPRSHRDFRETAIEAARFLQQRNPGAKITITDVRDGSQITFSPT